MKIIAETAIKLTGIGFLTMLVLSCSTTREQGEPNVDVSNTRVITTDEQRRAIYERGGTVTPQNANPIPTSDQLGMDEKASDTNRKKNIEEGGNTNAPAHTPTEERPRQLRNVGNDTITR